jgi:hypothetical protein
LFIISLFEYCLKTTFKFIGFIKYGKGAPLLMKEGFGVVGPAFFSFKKG